MPSTPEFRDYVLDQLTNLNSITYKSMMGEFLLYYNGTLFGGIYDDRLLIKKTESNKKYCLNEEIPYTGAKPMYMIENIDDAQYLTALIKNSCLYLNYIL